MHHVYGVLFSDTCWATSARQTLQARIPSNELLPMEHHTSLSTNDPGTKVKLLKIWVCRVVFTPVKHMFSLGFNMCSFARGMLSFRWLLLFSFLHHHHPTVPPCAHPASTTCTLHGLGAFVSWPHTRCGHETLWEKYHLKHVWPFSIGFGPKRAALSC